MSSYLDQLIQSVAPLTTRNKLPVNVLNENSLLASHAWLKTHLFTDAYAS